MSNFSHEHDSVIFLTEQIKKKKPADGTIKANSNTQTHTGICQLTITKRRVPVLWKIFEDDIIAPWTRCEAHTPLGSRTAIKPHLTERERNNAAAAAASITSRIIVNYKTSITVVWFVLR